MRKTKGVEYGVPYQLEDICLVALKKFKLLRMVTKSSSHTFNQYEYLAI